MIGTSILSCNCSKGQKHRLPLKKVIHRILPKILMQTNPSFYTPKRYRKGNTNKNGTGFSLLLAVIEIIELSTSNVSSILMVEF